MTNLLIYAGLVLTLVGGFVFGYIARKQWAKNRQGTVEEKIEKLIIDAKSKQKEILLKGQEKSIEILEEAKKEARRERQDLEVAKKRLEKRESLFDQKLMDLENKKQELADKTDKINRLKDDISKIKEEQFAKLEKIAALTKSEAEKILMDNVEKSMADNLVLRLNKMEAEASEELERKSKQILSTVIERCASSHAQESTSSIVDLPNDEMKGRIIGREGRNIRTIEQLTGVEIIIDDTPQAITISSFSPIRRQVAKKSLEKLIFDGRIHPARIEETIKEAKQEISLDIKKAGENAVYELGITGFDPKLIQILGRLKYRTSYGQNILNHSIEVANLSSLLAHELGADVLVAKKGGLLHDIGKAVDHEVQGTHPEIGRDICRKFGISEDVIKPVFEHHNDKPSTLEGVIVKVADAISGARPGARKDSYENYLQRLEELENIAKNFGGVDKVYAIQAGREVRVFVSPEEIDDLAAVKLAKNIAEKIEEDLKYPGEIKVNVIREKRVVEYAR
ncbi:MAG: ribonuclease Y [Candidatus Buchananbacteria bacterium RIFCSPHIGHO2_02_FULL_40_13]|uniref:Ribonuclease Y n=1 Tax=Candidatus Buchananbacteria bacterium RIFCSPLOWO2_01_FULL_39_33 TaxID=1797543 RepID=A0A1G1YHG9_9BACT|nr:MAG: ribonuclease Y [Candidatus Buchananbacteria bacterium RIFCSPHIGHO2_01_FULL_40_35]OGY49496.1 MAG: ribonuclease Y [Candidatus Buchananbacteria bacterium RIFCSPHIGHO2_02_FULL_40_13]OGY51711.1 MAG: ribonuclease Y [Candidatus Buchananbacteria bacterium RIFCSPLOWO2_01_FULL_39_33]